MTDETTSFRLVLCRCNVRNGAFGLGLLYPVGAGRWSQPEWSFRLSMTDPIPNVDPGSIVELDRPPRDGHRSQVSWGSGSFHTSHPLRTGAPDLGGRMFAQHGDEIRHPALGGSVQNEDVDSVRAQFRFQLRAGAAVLLFGGALTAAGVALGRAGLSTARAYFASAVVIAVAVFGFIANVWQRHTLRRAQRAATAHGRSMVLQLRWVVGTGFGAVALADVREAGTPPDTPHRRALGVVNVPESLIELEPHDHDCVVHGDLARGIVAIDVAGATLLPAPAPYRNVPSR